MKLKISAILASGLLIWAGCKKTDQGNPDPGPTPSDIITKENNRLAAAVTGQTTIAFVSGTIMEESGKTLAGVAVTCGNSTVTTNSKGYFQFAGSVTINKDYATIVATLPGYFKGFKTFTPNPSGKANHYFEFKLLKTGTAKTVSESGGNIELDNKISLSFPAAAVVTSSGAVYSGQYDVVARYMDPAATNFLDIMPGLLTGLNDQNQLQALQSFGMATVELKDGAGNPLQIAPGKTVTMKLPAPSNGPATIPLWHFNEKYGIWIKAGTATKSGDQYTAEVNHFSTWNLDLEMNSFRLEIQFNDPSGNALAGLHGEAYMEGVNKIRSFFTDNDGKVILINCPSSKPLTIRTFFQCDTLTKSIDPVTASRTEIITVPFGPGLKSYTIGGKLSGCDNAVLGNQPFTIAIQGDGSSLGLPGVTDANGNYSVTGMLCNNNNNPIPVQAIAFVDGEYRYAPAANITSSATTYNAQLCDTSSSVDDNFQIVFPDPALDSLIRGAINKPFGAILYKDVKNINELTGSNRINDLSGIQFCTSLKVFNLNPGANLTDLSLLKNLLTLQNLYIQEFDAGGITDITPLQNLTQLKSLTLRCPKLSEISTLQNMVQLESLSLISNSVSDISPLSNLTQITWLQLNTSPLNDFSPLASLTRLRSLDIMSSGLTTSDLDVLKNFKAMENLTIRFTTISDFSVLQELPALLYLHLDWNQISDVSQFAPLKNLVSLELEGNKVSDITSLKELTQIKYLKLSSNQISDITALSYMPLAQYVSIDHNKISDVTPLQNLNDLQLLWINNNKISNIGPLINGVSKLEVLRMILQETGPITQSQRDAFKASHPTCFVEW